MSDPDLPSTSRSKFPLIGVIALAIIVADQLTKLWVDADMRLYQSIPIIDGFLSLTYVRNTGAAFSLFADLPENIRLPFFIGVLVVAVIGIAWFIRQTPSDDKLTLVACALVLGGALGNGIDRIAYGSVIDFVDVYVGDWHWPAFNVADSSITIGVILLLASGIPASKSTSDDQRR